MTDLEFFLPDVGEGLADATILSWLVAEGDPVRRMEPMVEVETAKSSVEIPSPVDGVMVRHGAAAGETLPIAALLAVLRIPEGQVAGGPTPPAVTPTASEPATGAPRAVRDETPSVDPDPTAARSRPRAAPTVRRRAYRAGVDLADVAATGDGGRVLMTDLENHLAAQQSELIPTAPGPTAASNRQHGIQLERSQVLSPMRTAIVETLTQAWTSVPLITDLREVDATELKRLRPILRDEIGEEGRLTYTALFCSVVIATLRKHPEFNIWFDSDRKEVTYKEHVNLGVAVSVPGGLSVGVVHEAESLSPGDLATAIDDLAGRAREGRLSRHEITGATVTVTSFGTHGGWLGTPLVIPPQAVIVGVGAIKDRAVAVDGQVVVRPIAPLSVSADHRVIDGAELSTFCSTLERLIVEPARMVVV